MQVGRHCARRRHARELRELVDQVFQRLHFPDDRRRALLHEFVERLVERRQFPAHAFGRQLNWRQRILDFVRKPPRHLSPGGDLLRANERRHVVQHKDAALVVAVSAGQACDRGRDVQVAPLAHHGHFLRERVARARAA